jgi:hypothetical protein
MGLNKLVEMGTELDTVLSRVETERNLVYQKAIGAYILDKTSYTLKRDLGKYQPAVETALGQTFQSGEEILDHLREQTAKGDLSGIIAIRNWVAAEEIPSHSYSDPRQRLKNHFDLFSDVQEFVEKGLKGSSGREILSSLEERLAAKYPLEFTAEGVAQTVAQKMMAGEYDFYEEVMAVFQEHKEKPRYDTPAQHLDHFRQNRLYQKWLAWQEHLVAQQAEVEVATKEDYYQILGVKVDAGEAKLRKAHRILQRQFHSDIIRAGVLDELLDIPPGASRAQRAQIIEAAKKDQRRWAEVEAQTDSLVSERTEKTASESQKAAEAYEVLSNPEKRKVYDQGYAQKCLDQAAFYLNVAHSVDKFKMVRPSYSQDGSLDIENAVSLGLVDTLGRHNVIPQSLKFSGNTDAVVIGGPNGGGKSWTLITMANMIEWADAVGYVPAESAVLPKVDFFASCVNAGESIIGKSSFQNEIDRYLGLLRRYIEAGSPQNGIIFLDEPLASTSSEDQTAILISLIDFFRSRGVKVIITNHNHETYELLNRTQGADGQKINFVPVAFTTEEDFRLEYFDRHKTDQIKSRGIDVAEQMGVPGEVINVARYVRKVIDRLETGNTA